MAFELVIKNGTVVCPDRVIEKACIGVNGGKIAEISEQELEGAEVIDASGLHVFPGVVDPHTHVGFANMPKEEFYHESQNAALGGTTTMMIYMLQRGSYLEQHPGNRTLGDANCMVDYLFHYSIADQKQLKEIPALVSEKGVASYKYFMTCRGAESVRLKLEAVDDGLLYNYFKTLGEAGAIPCVHCENMEIYFSLSPALKEQGRDDLAAWDEARPSWAEAESIFRAVFLAAKAGCPKIYIVHLSSKAGLKMIRMLRGMDLGIEILVETCPHYLILDTDCEAGINAKVNPPIRSREDCEALWEGVCSGEIQTIGSDHCVRGYEQKRGSIWLGLPGFIGTGNVLQLVLEYGYFRKNIPLTKIVELISENPARIFGAYPKKGAIRVGSDADFALVDMNRESVLTAKNNGSLADLCVYEGMKVHATPVRTVLRGKTVMLNGELKRIEDYGEYIPASFGE
ncbi:MAG: amidohydrolase family protein [Oscillospiraceae bacterium]|nr:amidohydrolase family protein [Oscillospiraceae bacterium]